MKKTVCFPLVILLLLVACGEAPPPKSAEPRPVRTQIVGAGNTAQDTSAHTDSSIYSGEVHARFETTLGFRIPGKIVTRLVDSGAVVKAGQALARIDSSDAALQADQARAQAALAEAEVKRYRDLRAKNFVSQAALDARETTFKSAVAQAGLARNQSAYTTLTAERTGVVTAVLAEPGQVVAAGQPVLQLAPDGGREVLIALPETEVAQLAVGMPAEASLWSQGEGAPVLRGKIREISPAADPMTRTYAARISLPTAPDRLPLGLSASVRFPRQIDGAAIQIPMSAIIQQGKQPAVWVVGADHTVTLKPVTLGSYGSNDWATVTAGLVPGERIVTAGANKIRPGEKVRFN